MLSALAAATERLGLAVTLSISANHPYQAVRSLSTLDYVSGGRIGWNIVTGHLRGEHRALGLDQLDHDARYDRADEYMDVCYALWSGVRDGALQADKQSGIFADPAKVDIVRHEGAYFRCHTVPPALPSRQGTPGAVSGRIVGARPALRAQACRRRVRDPAAHDRHEDIHAAASAARRARPEPRRRR